MTNHQTPKSMTTSEAEDFLVSCLHDFLENNPLPTNTDDLASEMSGFLGQVNGS